MKITPIIVAIAMVAPAAAGAQSLTDTHRLVWHPAGKTPAMTYRPHAKSRCEMRFDNRRADKSQSRRCATASEVAKKSTAG